MASSGPAAGKPRTHRRRVEFPSSKQGVMLVGELVWPERADRPTSTPPTTPRPVAVLQHGLADDRDGFVLPRLAEELASRASIASLRFDFRGNGESGGEFLFGNAASGDVDDLEDAVSFLLRQGEGGGGEGGQGEGGQGEGDRVGGELQVEGNGKFQVVALVGHSKAGSTVVAYASRRRKKTERTGADADAGDAGDPLFVPLIVSVSARFDHADPGAITSRFGDDIFERVKSSSSERGARGAAGVGVGGRRGVPLSWRAGSSERRRLVEWELTAEDLSDRVETDMGSLCSRIPTETKLLFVHGEGDETVPPSAALRFAEAASASRRGATPTKPPPRVVMIEGADHNFTRKEKADELIDAIVSFVVEEGLSARGGG